MKNLKSLSSLSSGCTCVARESSGQDLLTAKKEAEALTTFVEDRLLSNSKCFFDALSKLKLDNFSNVKKSSLLSKEGKSVFLRADRNLFARLLVIGQSRKVDL